MCCISGRGLATCGRLDKLKHVLRCVVVALGLTGCVKHYRGEGVVLKVDATRQTLTISHRAIPRYMEAMVMPFTARHTRELAGLVPGSRVTFRLEVGSKATRISHIRRESTGIEDVPTASTPRLAVGALVPAFAFTDQNNRTVRLSDYLGRPVVLDFIYTRCPLPDVCPRLSASMARLQKRFGGRVPLLSITLDPQFDTPEVLAEYARRWQADPRSWRFLTGSEEQIRAVAAQFGLVYWPEEGLITHTAVTAIIDSEGKLAALLEGSRFTSQQLLDLTSTTLGLRAQSPAPGPPNPPAP